MHVAFSEPLGLFVGVDVQDGKLRRVSMTREARPEGGHPLLDRVLRHLETGRDDFLDVPLALDVTEFDLRVLEAMRAIPPGATWTYGELATRAGAVARAVGGACGRNPAPIVVPCHRVVGAGGALVHYSGEGGVATKRRLLEIEGALKPERSRQTRLE